MHVIEVPTFADFEREFAQRSTEAVLLALFFASLDPSTGESWCPDCRAVTPVIQKLASSSEAPVNLLYCYIGAREDWKNKPENPYRTHPSAMVKCVPTLIRFQGGTEHARLEEAQLLDEDQCRQLFSS